MKRLYMVLITAGVIFAAVVTGTLLLSRTDSKLRPAQNASDIQSQFNRVNQPRGWIGGDGGASLTLPDGRILFMWADSFVGTINTNRSYAPFYAFVRNSLTTMKPDGSEFTTYINGATGKESAYIPNVASRPNNHLWPYSGMVVNDKVLLVANEWQPDTAADFGSSFTGNTWLITLSLPDLKVTATQQIISNDQIQWGSTMYSDDLHTYIYGELGGKTYLYRTTRGQLGQPPEYRTQQGWSRNRSAIRAVSDFNIQAVTKIGDTYHALYMTQPFPKTISEASAPNLAGPWKNVSSSVFKIPEAQNKKLLQYMPRIHEALSSGGSYLMSYSVNAYRITDVTAHASYYQPHYLRGPIK